MQRTHIVGIDPGLVHTGCVRLAFAPELKQVHVRDSAISGINVKEIDEYARALTWGWHNEYGPVEVFVEAYRPRSNLNSDQRMVEGQGLLRKALPSNTKFLQNTGVKSVVKKPLMQLLDVWTFSTQTNHDDLRSAARIALLGMMKDPQHNELLADIVRDHLNGRTWNVSH